MGLAPRRRLDFNSRLDRGRERASGTRVHAQAPRANFPQRARDLLETRARRAAASLPN